MTLEALLSCDAVMSGYADAMLTRLESIGHSRDKDDYEAIRQWLGELVVVHHFVTWLWPSTATFTTALGGLGHLTRFTHTAAYANCTGTAPVQIASADSNRHRLSRYGDRQLNSGIHTAAMIQIRMPGSTGRVYHDKKIADGKTPRGAIRSLKRHLAGHF